jgi:NAD(P)-dependent dehydrogenase (short-subunit alcohol dehydrogenase family)
MTQTAVIMGVGDSFGAGLCREFETRGWTVFGLDAADLASATTVAAAAEHVDILVCNIGQNASAAMDFEAMLRCHERYGLGALRFFEAFLPLTAAGMKRICFITDPDAVVGARSPSTACIGDRMSWASIHMAAAIMANDLGPDGYSVRLYIPADGDSGPSQAFDYLTGPVDASRLHIDDYAGNRWSF